MFQSLKREIERRIDLIPRIVTEPSLLGNIDSRYILCPGQQVPAYYYRLKAVDDVKLLGKYFCLSILFITLLNKIFTQQIRYYRSNLMLVYYKLYITKKCLKAIIV